MVRLREIPRTAAFAWSPNVADPWIVTGTKSGAVDVDFSNETCLELWDLALDDAKQSHELKPVATIPTEVGFHDLTWTPPTEEHPKGLIAGGLDDGTLAISDAAKLSSDPEKASIYSKKVHSGAIKTLQYNPHPKFSHYLATAGAKGELFIIDLNDLDSAPIRLGSTAARADDIECLDWNKRVPNILVTGSNGGFVTVWDLKTRKESLTLNNNGRKAVSAVAWDPEKPTRLITAVPLEQEPLILVWDLRNSNAPEKVLRGHDNGVLSLSWCPQDSDLLLSSGKDNRTILWNPQTGEAYGDYPVVTNWTFQTRWNPKNPSMFATASFDGKLLVQTLQNTNPNAAAQQDETQQTDGEDFFSRAQTQPQSSSFTLTKAPRWLERPASVSFGFGGRLISVRPSEIGKRSSKISITRFEVDSDVGAATSSFEEAIQSGNIEELCKTRAADAKTDEEKSDWNVMRTLLSKSPRKELIRYLGFESSNEVAETPAKLDVIDKEVPNDTSKPQVNGSSGGKGHRRFESVFATDADGDFLSQLAAAKGTTNNTPFQLYTGSESEVDKKITRCVMLGKFEEALDICLAEERMSDAFMLAICGGENCTKKAQEAYFAKQGSGPNYLRLLASIVGKNLWDTVHNAGLENWRDIMATLCTFADEQEFPDLCEALGDRLEEQVSTSPAARKDAAFCYLAGSKLEKVISIWISELKQHEEEGVTNASESTAFSVHARALQDLIEKVTIFRKVVNFRDEELTKTSDWKLDTLYQKYLEYSDIVAGHGQLEAASKYLSLLPVSYPEADVARARISQATKKPVVPQAAQQAATSAATPSRQQRQMPTVAYQQPAHTFTPAGPQMTSQFGGSTAAPPSGMPPSQSAYAPPSNYQPSRPAQQQNPYAPQGGYQPPQQMSAGVPPPPQQFGVPQAPPQYGAPPRVFNQSPSVPPPSQAKNMTNWNDLPEGFAKVPTPRRGTPSVPGAAVAQPQNQFYSTPSPPQTSAGQYGAKPPQKAIPPPPKAGEVPHRVQSPLSQDQSIQRPPSIAHNAYAPPVSQQGQSTPLAAPAPPPIARGASPYNAPPAGAPPPNRYAPAPGSQSTVPGPSARREIAPPPQASQFGGASALSNPYAPTPPPGGSAVLNQYAPQQRGSSTSNPPPPQQFINTASAPTGPPQSAPRPGTQNSDRPGSAKAPPAARTHPKGDRSHIPSSAQPIYDILSSEMSRVEARAPTAYKAQVVDTRKRLDILFDHLNNEELLQPATLAQIVELSQALQNKDFARASEIQVDVQVNKVDECGNWMVGVKRLIGMSKATP